MGLSAAPTRSLRLHSIRIVGYCAHWRESLVDPDTKIIRPQQYYRGVWLRHYEEVVKRSAEGERRAPVFVVLSLMKHDL